MEIKAKTTYFYTREAACKKEIEEDDDIKKLQIRLNQSIHKQNKAADSYRKNYPNSLAKMPVFCFNEDDIRRLIDKRTSQIHKKHFPN